MTGDRASAGRPQPDTGMTAQASGSARTFQAGRDMIVADGSAEHDARLADLVPAVPVADLDAYALGVHVATLPAGSWHGGETQGMTPYLERAHDIALRAEIGRAFAGGGSLLVLLAGDSTTGKTRALYEALRGHEEVRRWPMLRPADASELNSLIREQRIAPGTVLWLNETQKYLYGADGEKAAYGLLRLLESVNFIIVVGAMWQVYFDELAGAGRPGDPTAGARELLDGPHTRKISVPGRMGPAEQRAIRALPGSDARLAIAVAASGEEGQVIQHLTGGPELLDAYLDGGLFNPVEHALITAALEARRLGHHASLPGPLLAAAADGYLTGRQRPGRADWASAALADITAGVRSEDGTRTDVRKTLTALTAYRDRAGQAEPTYEPNDFLDQNTRARRQAQLGTPELWNAMAENAAVAEDLHRLGRAAQARGMYRHAARMWFRAAGIGHPASAAALLRAIARADDDAFRRAADWVVEHATLNDARGTAVLLHALRGHEVDETTAALTARAAEQASLDSPGAAAVLIGRLRQAGAYIAAGSLATRAAPQVPLESSSELIELLEMLLQIGAHEAVAALAARAAQQAPLDSPRSVALLITALRHVGADEAMAVLAARAAQQVPLDSPRGVATLIGALRMAAADVALAELLSRNPVAHISLDSLRGVADLVGVLRRAGAEEAGGALAARAAEQAPLGDPQGVARLIRTLRKVGMVDPLNTLAARVTSLGDLLGHSDLVEALRGAGADAAIAALAALATSVGDSASISYVIGVLREAGADVAVAAFAARAADHADFDNPRAVAAMIGVLRRARADAAVAALATRAAEHASVDNARGIAYLLRVLGGAGADEAVAALAARAAEHASLDNPRGVAELLQVLRRAGAGQAVAALMARNPARLVYLSDARGANRLFRALRELGTDEMAIAFLVRAVDSGTGEYLYGLLIQATANPTQAEELRQFGRESDGKPSPPWGWHDLQGSAHPEPAD
jgi:hypothetical protein